MQTIFIFMATAVISLVGSLQLGPVNLTVVQYVLQRSFKAGLYVAIGGCLPEMLYATAALYANQWLTDQPIVEVWARWLSIPILLFLGIITFRSKTSSSLPSDKTTATEPFSKGLLMALLNPQLLPFWLVVLVQMNSYELLQQTVWQHHGAFVVGTAAGALGLLLAVAKLTDYYREKILIHLTRLPFQKVLGMIFIGLALIQALKILF